MNVHYKSLVVSIKCGMCQDSQHYSSVTECAQHLYDTHETIVVSYCILLIIFPCFKKAMNRQVCRIIIYNDFERLVVSSKVTRTMVSLRVNGIHLICHFCNSTCTTNLYHAFEFCSTQSPGITYT